jgi:nucleoid-associated protein YejK
LNDKDRADFIDRCEVLVRLHTREAVSDYRQLVKSTNNQNPMQPRNLRSNDPEQLDYEKLFAQMNWFYARKEGAWQAFKSDASLWGSLRGKKQADFKALSTGQVRNLDNLEMSQA